MHLLNAEHICPAVQRASPPTASWGEKRRIFKTHNAKTARWCVGLTGKVQRKNLSHNSWQPVGLDSASLWGPGSWHQGAQIHRMKMKERNPERTEENSDQIKGLALVIWKEPDLYIPTMGFVTYVPWLTRCVWQQLEHHDKTWPRARLISISAGCSWHVLSVSYDMQICCWHVFCERNRCDATHPGRFPWSMSQAVCLNVFDNELPLTRKAKVQLSLKW